MTKAQYRMVWAILEVEECVFLHEETFLDHFLLDKSTVRGRRVTLSNIFLGAKHWMFETMTFDGIVQQHKREIAPLMQWVQSMNEDEN